MSRSYLGQFQSGNDSSRSSSFTTSVQSSSFLDEQDCKEMAPFSCSLVPPCRSNVFQGPCTYLGPLGARRVVVGSSSARTPHTLENRKSSKLPWKPMANHIYDCHSLLPARYTWLLVRISIEDFIKKAEEVCSALCSCFRPNEV